MKIRTVFFIMIFLALVFVPVHAQSDEPPIPASPPNGTYVLDELDWLTSDQETELNSIIQGLDNDRVTEIAVVTLNDCGTDKQTFRKSLFNTWGIGHTDDNDGLLILVCWYGGDKTRRSVEQEYGPGLADSLSPGATDRVVQENFIPSFQSDQPGVGLMEMVKRYNFALRSSESSRSNTGIYILIGVSLFLVLTIFLIVKLVRARGNKSRGRSMRDSGWFVNDGGGSGSDGGGGGFDGGSSDGGGGSSSDF